MQRFTDWSMVIDESSDIKEQKMIVRVQCVHSVQSAKYWDIFGGKKNGLHSNLNNKPGKKTLETQNTPEAAQIGIFPLT